MAQLWTRNREVTVRFTKGVDGGGARSVVDVAFVRRAPIEAGARFVLLEHRRPIGGGVITRAFFDATLDPTRR